MYRYSVSQYNAQLLNLGIVRVGTLHDFRKSEHARGIGDPQEGKKRVKKDIEHIEVDGPNDPNAGMLEMFGAIRLGPGAGVTLRNVRLVKSFDHPNCFIFCTSKRRSAKTMAEFDGADSCVEIFDIERFYSLLTYALNLITPVTFRGLFDVVYQDREEDWNGKDWGHHPARIKERHFLPQYELRAIWEPKYGQVIEPTLVGHFRLGQFCRLVQV